MKECPNCQTFNEDSAVDCIKCKTRFDLQPKSNTVMIVGIVVAIVGLAVLIYGSALNNSLEAQLTSLFETGNKNPGTPFVIFGGATLVVGVLVVVKHLFNKK